MSQPPSQKNKLDARLVSVITPVFNSERFIEETIQCVQAQTYPHWEMLVLIDAGTRDRTAEIVERVSATDPRVKLVNVSGGRNVSDARNHGFGIAKGKYVAFLDADDLWLPEKLEVQLSRMRETGAALSFTAFRRISIDGGDTGRVIQVPEELSYSDLLKVNVIACLTAVVDQEQTGTLHMRNDIHEDYTLWLSILRRGLRAVGVQRDLGRYRIVAGSRSSKKALMASWRWQVYREHEGLSAIASAYYFAWYAILTVAKHLRF